MRGMGISELVILAIIVGIPVVVIASRKKKKSQASTETTETTTFKRPQGATALAWIIIAATILEFGLVILENLNTTAFARRNNLFLYEIGVSVLKVLICIGIFRGINLARWSWVVFGLLLFGLNEWNVWRGLMVTLGQVSVVYLFTEFMKIFWIGTLFFIFKANMNTYFKGIWYSKTNKHSKQQKEH